MKKTITAFVHYEKAWHDSMEDFRVFPFDMTSGDCVLVGKQEIEIEVPDDFDPTPGMIAALEEQKRKLRLKLANELMELDQRISKLQAIEFTPEAA